MKPFLNIYLLAGKRDLILANHAARSFATASRPLTTSTKTGNPQLLKISVPDESVTFWFGSGSSDSYL